MSYRLSVARVGLKDIVVRSTKRYNQTTQKAFGDSLFSPKDAKKLSPLTANVVLPSSVNHHFFVRFLWLETVRHGGIQAKPSREEIMLAIQSAGFQPLSVSDQVRFLKRLTCLHVQNLLSTTNHINRAKGMSRIRICDRELIQFVFLGSVIKTNIGDRLVSVSVNVGGQKPPRLLDTNEPISPLAIFPVRGLIVPRSLKNG